MILAALGCLPTVICGTRNKIPRSDTSLESPRQGEDGERLIYESWIRNYCVAPPGNQLEALRGDRPGQRSIRINDQWRICFTWRGGHCYDVEIVDHH